MEAESVVESVVRDEANEAGGEDVNESAELDAGRTVVSIFPGFGERDTSDAPVGEDVESCVETRIIPLLVTSALISTIWQTREVIFSRN